MNLRCSLPATLLLVSFGVAQAATGNASERALNNEGLVVLARAGYNERFLAEMIRAQPNRFDTSVEGLVYLARQGMSERIVRLVISEQKAQERREAERANSDDFDDATPAGGAAQAKTPVRLKVVKQRVLVPVAAKGSGAAPQLQLGAAPMIVVEKRLFGDRYYAMPGAQAPMMSPVATPRSPQAMPAHALEASTTRIAAFR